MASCNKQSGLTEAMMDYDAERILHSSALTIVLAGNVYQAAKNYFAMCMRAAGYTPVVAGHDRRLREAPYTHVVGQTLPQHPRRRTGHQARAPAFAGRRRSRAARKGGAV
jgi:hypothetical protein